MLNPLTSPTSSAYCERKVGGMTSECSYNVSETNRLKQHYWKEKALGRIADSGHGPTVG